jgi:predicted HTH domain antitoxin
MDPLFQEERISAYLDGQLPSDERVKFEEELAHNSELRQVVEELRQLHDSLQELPRHHLNDDFATQVLRRAERAMLSNPQAVANERGADGVAAEGSQIVQAASNTTISNARRSRRPWIWAAIAVAAAVALMVFNPPRQKPVQIAQTDSSPAPRAADRQKVDRSLPEDAPAVAAQDKARMLFHEAESPAKEQGTAAAAGALQQMHERSDFAAEPSVKAGSASAASQPAPPAGATADSFKTDLERDLKRNRATTSNGAVAGEAPAPAGDVEFRQNSIQSAESASNRSAKGLAGKPPPVDGVAADERKLAEPPGVSLKGAASGGGQSSSARRSPAAANQYADGNVRAGRMIVAEYATAAEMPPTVFQRLLEKRGIALHESAAANLELLGAVRSAAADRLSAPSAFRRNEALRPMNKGGTSDRPPRLSAADEAPLEVVYVVGTRDQVMGLVDDLHAQPARFQALAVSAVAPVVAGETKKDANAATTKLLLDENLGQGASDKSYQFQQREANPRNQPATPSSAAPSSALSGAALRPAMPLPPAIVPPAPSVAPSAKTQEEPSRPKDEKLGDQAGTISAPAAGGRAGDAAAPSDAAEKSAAKQLVPKNPPAVRALTQGPTEEQRTTELAAPRPATTPPGAVTEFKTANEPTERTKSSAWAARMTSLPPDAEKVLRQSLAPRENQPTDRNVPLELPRNKSVAAGRQKAETGSYNDSTPDRGEDVEKAQDNGQLQQKRDAVWRDVMSRASAGGGGDQVRAVFIFRLSPGNASPATAAAAPSTPAPAIAAPAPAALPATAPGKPAK